MTPPTRRALYSGKSAPQVRDFLQTLLVTELVAPSPDLWLVSPWISDVAVLDNRTLGFAYVEPDWPASDIGLSRVLLHLAGRGCRIRVVTRPPRRFATAAEMRYTEAFLDQLRRQKPPLADVQVLANAPELHAKGLLTQRFYLSGSMNFTYNGIYVLDEHLELTTDPESVNQAFAEFSRRYADRLHAL